MIRFSFLFIFFISSSIASSYCEKYPYIEPAQYRNIKETISAGLAKLSSTSPIANQADKTLSSLITAKSPLIIKWIATRNLDPLKNETQIVTEWRSYFLENFVLGKFPSQDPAVNSRVEKLFKEINSVAFDSKNKNKIKHIFAEAKTDSLSYIKESKFSKSEKALLFSRIKKVELYFYSAIHGTKYAHRPLEFLKWGLAFDPSVSQINVGVDVLKYGSDEELYTVLLHEIAHAFDPCRWSAFVKTKYPFSDVVKCLRSDKSVSAKSRDDSKLELMLKSRRITSDLYKSLIDNPTCNNSTYPQVGMQKDQISEVFADWFSTEVLVNFKKEYLIKAFRSELCTEDPLQKGSSYITNTKRLNGIYLSHPNLGRLYTLGPRLKNCSL